MKKANFLKNQNGFSLVEIMIAIGMLGALSLALTQMMSTVGKADKKNTQNFEMRNILSTISYNLTDSQACINTLGGRNPNGTADAPINRVASIKNGLGIDTFVEGGKYGVVAKGSRAQFTLKQMNILKYDPGSNMASLRISFEKMTVEGGVDVNEGRNTLGSLMQDFEIPLRVKVDGTNLIEYCFTDKEELTRTICEKNFSGILSETDNYECQSIKIRESAAPENAAVTINSGSMEITNSGPSIANAAGGNLDLVGSMGIGTTRSIGTGNISLSGSIGVGNSYNPILTSGGHLNMSGALGIGIPGVPTDVPAGLPVGNIQTSSDINVLGGVRVGSTSIVDPPAGQLISRSNITVMAQPTTDTVLKHAATIEWVKQRVSSTLSPTGAEVSGIASDMLNILYNEPQSGLNVIKKAACENSYVMSGNNILTVGTWSAGNICLYNVLHCSQSGICPTVYSNGIIQAGSNISGVGATSDVISANNITATSGFVRSNTYVRAGTFIQAGSYVLGVQRVCAGSTSSCYTKFQSLTCSGSSSAMVGIRNGHIICAPKW